MIAKFFKNGRSTAVRIPAAFGFEGCKEVFMAQDPETGDVILSRRPLNWDGFFSALGKVPSDFLDATERHQEGSARDPFPGWQA
jgi:antitoxin VapB